MLFPLKTIFQTSLLLILAVSLHVELSAQSRKEKKAIEAQRKADDESIKRIQTHYEALHTINDLSSYRDYIIGRFKNAGLQPSGTSGYLTDFTIDDGKQVDTETYLSINGNRLELNSDYFPLSYSAEKKISGMPSMALREKGVPWFIDVKDILDAKPNNDTINIHNDIINEAVKVYTKGATALFVYNSSATNDSISFDRFSKLKAVDIPVVYITKEGYQKYFSDHSQTLDLELHTRFANKKVSGTNVSAIVNNNANHTLIISSYLPVFSNPDRGNSDYKNASLIELALKISLTKNIKSNILFIIFDGERNGLYGKKYWLTNSSSSTALFISGSDPIQLLSPSELIVNDKAIAAVSTFTSDEKDLTKLLQQINQVADTMSKFDPAVISENATIAKDTKVISTEIEKNITRETSTDNALPKETKPAIPVQQAAKTSVSLGIIPDNANNEGGMKIKGVTPKKLAERLGLQSGDVLISLGDHSISDMTSYLKALSNFGPGDKTILKIKRGAENISIDVAF